MTWLQRNPLAHECPMPRPMRSRWWRIARPDWSDGDVWRCDVCLREWQWRANWAGDGWHLIATRLAWNGSEWAPINHSMWEHP